MKKWVIIILFICIALVLASCTSNDKNMEWAHNLKVSDVEKIEAISLPNLENERYKKFDVSEFADIVVIVNNAKGKKVDEPEGINGGVLTYYITTSNSELHTFANNGNTYLVIDGVSYKASYDYLSKWGHSRLDSKIPNDFVLSLGTYVSSDKLVTVILQDNNEFVIAYSAASYSPIGQYTIVEDKLILKVADDEEYVFLIGNGKLIFESGTWLENWIELGAEFQLFGNDASFNDYRPMIFVKGNLYGDTGNYVDSLSDEWKYIGSIKTVIPQNEAMIKEEFTANTLTVGDEVYYSDSFPNKVYIKITLNANDRYIAYELLDDN